MKDVEQVICMHIHGEVARETGSEREGGSKRDSERRKEREKLYGKFLLVLMIL